MGTSKLWGSYEDYARFRAAEETRSSWSPSWRYSTLGEGVGQKKRKQLGFLDEENPSEQPADPVQSPYGRQYDSWESMYTSEKKSRDLADIIKKPTFGKLRDIRPDGRQPDTSDSGGILQTAKDFGQGLWNTAGLPGWLDAASSLSALLEPLDPFSGIKRKITGGVSDSQFFKSLADKTAFTDESGQRVEESSTAGTVGGIAGDLASIFAGYGAIKSGLKFGLKAVGEVPKIIQGTSRLSKIFGSASSVDRLALGTSMAINAARRDAEDVSEGRIGRGELAADLALEGLAGWASAGTFAWSLPKSPTIGNIATNVLKSVGRNAAINAGAAAIANSGRLASDRMSEEEYGANVALGGALGGLLGAGFEGLGTVAARRAAREAASKAANTQLYLPAARVAQGGSESTVAKGYPSYLLPESGPAIIVDSPNTVSGTARPASVAGAPGKGKTAIKPEATTVPGFNKMSPAELKNLGKTVSGGLIDPSDSRQAAEVIKYHTTQDVPATLRNALENNQMPLSDRLMRKQVPMTDATESDIMLIAKAERTGYANALVSKFAPEKLNTTLELGLPPEALTDRFAITQAIENKWLVQPGRGISAVEEKVRTAFGETGLPNAADLAGKTIPPAEVSGAAVPVVKKVAVAAPAPEPPASSVVQKPRIRSEKVTAYERVETRLAEAVADNTPENDVDAALSKLVKDGGSVEFTVDLTKDLDPIVSEDVLRDFKELVGISLDDAIGHPDLGKPFPGVSTPDGHTVKVKIAGGKATVKVVPNIDVNQNKWIARKAQYTSAADITSERIASRGATPEDIELEPVRGEFDIVPDIATTEVRLIAQDAELAGDVSWAANFMNTMGDYVHTKKPSAMKYLEQLRDTSSLKFKSMREDIRQIVRDITKEDPKNITRMLSGQDEVMLADGNILIKKGLDDNGHLEYTMSLTEKGKASISEFVSPKETTTPDIEGPQFDTKIEYGELPTVIEEYRELDRSLTSFTPKNLIALRDIAKQFDINYKDILFRSVHSMGESPATDKILSTIDANVKRAHEAYIKEIERTLEDIKGSPAYQTKLQESLLKSPVGKYYDLLLKLSESGKAEEYYKAVRKISDETDIPKSVVDHSTDLAENEILSANETIESPAEALRNSSVTEGDSGMVAMSVFGIPPKLIKLGIAPYLGNYAAGLGLITSGEMLDDNGYTFGISNQSLKQASKILGTALLFNGMSSGIRNVIKNEVGPSIAYDSAHAIWGLASHETNFKRYFRKAAEAERKQLEAEYGIPYEKKYKISHETARHIMSQGYKPDTPEFQQAVDKWKKLSDEYDELGIVGPGKKWTLKFRQSAAGRVVDRSVAAKFNPIVRKYYDDVITRNEIWTQDKAIGSSTAMREWSNEYSISKKFKVDDKEISGRDVAHAVYRTHIDLDAFMTEMNLKKANLSREYGMPDEALIGGWTKSQLGRWRLEKWNAEVADGVTRIQNKYLSDGKTLKESELYKKAWTEYDDVQNKARRFALYSAHSNSMGIDPASWAGSREQIKGKINEWRSELNTINKLIAENEGNITLWRRKRFEGSENIKLETIDAAVRNVEMLKANADQIKANINVAQKSEAAVRRSAQNYYMRRNADWSGEWVLRVYADNDLPGSLQMRLTFDDSQYSKGQLFAKRQEAEAMVKKEQDMILRQMADEVTNLTSGIEKLDPATREIVMNKLQALRDKAVSVQSGNYVKNRVKEIHDNLDNVSLADFRRAMTERDKIDELVTAAFARRDLNVDISGMTVDDVEKVMTTLGQNGVDMTNAADAVKSMILNGHVPANTLKQFLMEAISPKIGMLAHRDNVPGYLREVDLDDPRSVRDFMTRNFDKMIYDSETLAMDVSHKTALAKINKHLDDVGGRDFAPVLRGFISGQDYLFQYPLRTGKTTSFFKRALATVGLGWNAVSASVNTILGQAMIAADNMSRGRGVKGLLPTIKDYARVMVSMLSPHGNIKQSVNTSMDRTMYNMLNSMNVGTSLFNQALKQEGAYMSAGARESAITAKRIATALGPLYFQKLAEGANNITAAMAGARRKLSLMGVDEATWSKLGRLTRDEVLAKAAAYSTQLVNALNESGGVTLTEFTANSRAMGSMMSEAQRQIIDSGILEGFRTRRQTQGAFTTKDITPAERWVRQNAAGDVMLTLTNSFMRVGGQLLGMASYTLRNIKSPKDFKRVAANAAALTTYAGLVTALVGYRRVPGLADAEVALSYLWDMFENKDRSQVVRENFTERIERAFGNFAAANYLALGAENPKQARTAGETVYNALREGSLTLLTDVNFSADNSVIGSMETIGLSTVNRIAKNTSTALGQADDGTWQAVATLFRAFIPSGLDRALYSARSVESGGYVDSWATANTPMEYFDKNDEIYLEALKLALGGKPVEIRRAQEAKYTRGGGLYTEEQRAKFASAITSTSSLKVLPEEKQGEQMFARIVAERPELAEDLRTAILNRYDKIQGKIKVEKEKLRQWISRDKNNQKFVDEAARKGLSVSDQRKYGTYLNALDGIIEDHVLRGMLADVLNRKGIEADVDLTRRAGVIRRAKMFNADPEELLQQPYKDAILKVWEDYDATLGPE